MVPKRYAVVTVVSDILIIMYVAAAVNTECNKRKKKTSKKFSL